MKRLLLISLLLYGLSLAAQPLKKLAEDTPVFSIEADPAHPVLVRMEPGSEEKTFILLYHNKKNVPFDGILNIGSPFIRQLQIELLNENGHKENISLGAVLPFKDRPLPTTDFTIPIHVDPAAFMSIQITMDNNGYEERIPIKLWEAKSWERHRNRRNFLISGYISVNIFGLFFGFIVLTAIRAHFRYSYIYYFSVGLLLVVVFSGVGYRYLWPQFPQVQNVMFYILINATLLGGFRFIQRFFRTKWKLPKLDIVIFVLMTGLAIFATLSLLSVHMSREAIGIIQNLNFIWLILSSTAFLLTPLVYYYKTGNIEALWFLFAYLLHLSSLIFVSMQGLGLIYLPPWFERVIWFGVINLHFVLSILILFRVRGVVRKQAQSRINLARERADRLRDLVLQEEMERERIGADLHDEAGSRFAGIKMGLSKLAWNESNPAKKATLTKVIDDVDKICDLNRSISHQLLSVSLNKVGLKEALREYQSRLRKKGRLVGFLYSEGTLDGLTKSAGILVYRVIIEIVDGIYEDLDEFRIRIEEIRVSSELLLTVEAIEEVNLVKIDADSITINSLRTRLALFNRSREEPLQVDEKGIRIWLPKVVEAVGSRQVSGQGTKTRK